MKNFRYGTDKLTLGSALALIQGRLQATLSAKVRHKVDQSANVAKENAFLAEITSASPPPQSPEHAADVNDVDTIAFSIAKAMMIMKAQTFAQGYSGVELRTLERMIWMTEQNIIPAIPSQTATETSGGGALEAFYSPLVGQGKVYYKGGIVPAKMALKTYGMSPLQLGEHERKALIAGTQLITAYAVYALNRLHNVAEVADLAGALSLEGLQGSYHPFQAQHHDTHPLRGNQLVAHRLWQLLHTSEIASPHIEPTTNPDSLRYMPNVHGAVRTAWLHLKELTEIEINAVSSGNPDNLPLAPAIDYVAASATKLRDISERRCQLLTEKYPDLHTVFIPTSAIPNTTGAGNLDIVINDLEYMLASELRLASLALGFQRPRKSSETLEACHALVSSEGNIKKLQHLISSGQFLAEANRAAEATGLKLLNTAFSSFEI